MKNLTLILAIALLTATVGCNKTEQTTETSAATETQPETNSKTMNVKSQDAKELLSGDEDVVILDVRTPEEFSGGHLQKSINVDYNAPGFGEKLDKLDKNKKYLVYCAAGGRSAKAAALMEEKGFAQVYNCEEGYEDLKQEGVSTE